jgi:dolichol-phosphate mannosyltransferase
MPTLRRRSAARIKPDMPALTVVIPTFNEAENLPALAAQLWDLPLEGLKLLIVDDASPDGTGEIADSLKRHHPERMDVIHRSGKLGLGSAYLEGFQLALDDGAEAIAQMDADFSHSPEYLPGFVEDLAGADAVLGSRYVPEGRLDERWGIGRVFLSWFGNTYARTILSLPILDVTGGFRVWRRQTLLGMPRHRVRSNGYVFQVEMAYLAYKLGYKLVERPIYFEDRRIGQSKMSFRIQVEAAIRVWQLLFKYGSLEPDKRPTP